MVATTLRKYAASQSIDALIGRGTVYAGLHKLKKALSCFQQADRERKLHQLPANPQLARLIAAVQLELGKTAIALDTCEKVLRSIPEHPTEEWLDLSALRCHALFHLNQFAVALPALDTLVQQRQQIGLPDEHDLHINRATAASFIGYTDAALEILDYVAHCRQEQGLALDPDLTYRKAIACLQGSKRPQACQYARQALQEYMENDPHNPGIIDIKEFLTQVCSNQSQ